MYLHIYHDSRDWMRTIDKQISVLFESKVHSTREQREKKLFVNLLYTQIYFLLIVKQINRINNFIFNIITCNQIETLQEIIQRSFLIDALNTY